MRHPVLRQAALEAERLAAYRTHMRPLPRMREFMLLEVVFPCEAFPALCTYEGFFASVR
jgi:hypothetical protein